MIGILFLSNRSESTRRNWRFVGEVADLSGRREDDYPEGEGYHFLPVVDTLIVGVAGQVGCLARQPDGQLVQTGRKRRSQRNVL